MPVQESLKYAMPRAFSDFFDMGKIDTASSLNTIPLKNDIGNGAFVFNQFDNDFLTLEGHLVTNKAIEIDLDFLSSDFFLFLFVTKGSCKLNFEDQQEIKDVGKLASISVFTKNNHLTSIQIGKNKAFGCHSILIGKQKFLSVCDDYSKVAIGNDQLARILDNLEFSIFSSDFCFDIIDELKKIESIDKKNAPMALLKSKSRYQLVLAFHLEQIYNSIYNRIGFSGLTEREIKTINLVAEYITENPGLNHLQSNLCKRFFISQSKLQQGFKQVHKTTVSAFTKTVRLKKASTLLSDYELNVSEIVYSVGFTSRSYFSKIFKIEYGVSPTIYRFNSLAKERSVRK